MIAYPEAKIVLVERDVEDWYRSFDATVVTELFSRVADMSVNYIEPLVGSQIGLLSRKILYGYFHANTPDEVRKNARGAYREHYRRIREAAPKERLLEYRLGEEWGPLCNFLGKEVPELPFPRINEVAALKAKVRKTQLELLKGAAGTVSRYLVPLVVVGIAMRYWYRS